jgi:hypothetical protein
LGSGLPWRLVPAIVADPRDTSEHTRIAPSVVEAGVAAEAAKVTTEAMIAASNPLHGPALVGTFESGWSSGPWGHHVHVISYPSHFAWMWRCRDGIPRVGVGVRVVKDVKDAAEVQYAAIHEFSEREQLELLHQWDAFGAGHWMSENFLGEMVTLAGLDQPK